MAEQLDLPFNDLTAILSAGEGPSSLPPADPVLAHALKHGMSEMDSDDERPGIHISGGTGGIKVLADPSRDQARARRARLGPPPPDPRMSAREFIGQAPSPMYAPPMYAPPVPMTMGAQITVQGVDFMRGVLLTSHGAIPLSPETTNKIMQLSVATMREFFAESVNATMQAYGLGGKRRAKPKRRKPKKV